MRKRPRCAASVRASSEAVAWMASIVGVGSPNRVLIDVVFKVNRLKFFHRRPTFRAEATNEVCGAHYHATL